MGLNSKRIAQAAWAFLALGTILAVCGCGGPGVGTVTSVTISPASSTLTLGTLNNQAEFTAAVTIAGQNVNTTNASSTAVTWYVNGVSGGNSTYGTIIVDPNNPQGGIYTAPRTIPSSTTCGVSGQVCITATAQKNPNGTAGGGANSLITSNQAVLTLSPALGIQIVSPPTTVPAGGSAQFTANFNGQADPTATWSISSSNGGNIGSIIANSGVYSAPTLPPPGDVVTIKASDSGVSASTAVEIVYSDIALHGSFAFTYTGNDSQGYLAAAGSIFADGQGHIRSGVEDISSYLSGISAQLPIASTSTYTVGPDGRGTISLDTSRGVQTLAFALTANTRALITRFDSSTGSGTMEQQSLAALGGSNSTIAGSYIFSALGADASFSPLAIAGEFSASAGTISAANSVVDIHDGASSSATITTNGSLSADSSYSFDIPSSGTGRGTLTLNTSLGTLDFAFYVIDSTELYMVEIDGLSHPELTGTVFSANTASTGLPGPNYVFTSGGSASFTANSATTVGAYAAGGVFVSNGAGSVSSGALDVNNQGNTTTNATLVSCSYTVGTNGRIDLKLFTGTSGSCPTGSAANLSEFAMYPYQTDQTDQPGTGFLMIEIDPNALTTGAAYAQASAASLTAGGYAFSLAGQGIAHGTRAVPTTAAQDVDGEFSTLLGAAGELDVNFFQPYPPNQVGSAAFGGTGTMGRGTLVVTGRSPLVTYDLVYYVIGSGEALLLDADNNSSFVMTGAVQRQF